MKRNSIMAVKKDKNNFDLHLPEDTTFNGNIDTESNARIEGNVKGNITSQNGNLLFGVNSKINGNVTGIDIAVSGQIKGDITASGQVSIFSGAKITGNVKASSFIVENDAFFEGSLLISSSEIIDAPETATETKAVRRFKSRKEDDNLEQQQ